MLSAVNWDVIWERLFRPDSTFLHALWTTVYVAIASEILAILLGLLTALMRRSRFRLVRTAAATYVLLMRGTPLIVQVFFIYFGASLFLGFDPFPREVDFRLFVMSGAVLAGIVALSLNEGAYVSEIVRSGIDAIDKGQMEAALSVGMTYRLAMRRIVLPQAARVMVPPLGNSFNGMIKATSLLAFIGVYEIFQDAQIHYSATFLPVEYFAAVAGWYLLLTIVWSVIQAQIERRLAMSEKEDERSFFRRVLDAWTTTSGMR